MEASDLITRYPVLYHMAEPRSWPGIVADGLLCTSSLLNVYGVTGTMREAIERRRRPEKVTIRCDGRPPATVRDQKPINDDELSASLSGSMTNEQWYLAINGKVFFWPDMKRLKWMMWAAPYVRDEHLVIAVDTALLLSRFGERVRLSAINSGSTRASTATGQIPRRGPDTFQPLSTFPSRSPVAEVAVDDRIEDIRSVALRAEIMRCQNKGADPECVRGVWTRP